MKNKMDGQQEDRSPWRDGFAAAAQFARDMGMRRRAGFNPYGFEIFEPTLSESSELAKAMGFRNSEAFSEPNFNGFGF